jgi:hypothetical protein
MVSRIADVRPMWLELVSRVRHEFICAAVTVPERSLIEETTGLARTGGSEP